MSANDKRGLAGWLGFRAPFDYSKARWLGRIVSGVMILMVGALFILAVASAIAMLSGAVFGDASLTPGNSLGVGAVTVALIGAPFVIWRSVVAQKSVDVQEQGQITDRINKAVEGLGAEKETNWIGQSVRISAPTVNGAPEHDRALIRILEEKISLEDHEEVSSEGDWRIFTESQPNLEVRIGAILALERIMQDSTRDYLLILELLCTYIRENAPVEKIEEKQLPENSESPELSKKAVWELINNSHELPRPRVDIQVAIDVIGRNRTIDQRLEDERSLNLTNCNLQSVDLHGLDLSKVNFWGSDLQNADLTRAVVDCAVLRNCNFLGARFFEVSALFAEFSNSNMTGVKFIECNFRDAKLEGVYAPYTFWESSNADRASFFDAELFEASFYDTTLTACDFSGSDLGDSVFVGCNAQEIRLEAVVSRRVYSGWVTPTLMRKQHRCSLVGAVFYKTDLRDSIHLEGFLNTTFGDASVVLSESIEFPYHWPNVAMSWDQIKSQWRKWQADPDNYTPPKAPDEE